MDRLLQCWLTAANPVDNPYCSCKLTRDLLAAAVLANRSRRRRAGSRRRRLAGSRRAASGCSGSGGSGSSGRSGGRGGGRSRSGGCGRGRSRGGGGGGGEPGSAPQVQLARLGSGFAGRTAVGLGAPGRLHRPGRDGLHPSAAARGTRKRRPRHVPIPLCDFERVRCVDFGSRLVGHLGARSGAAVHRAHSGAARGVR